MKTCSKCGEDKPDDQFRPKKWQCKSCIAARTKLWREENNAEIKVKAKAHRDTQAASRRDYQAKWREDNKELIAAKADENREKNRQRVRAYKLRNKDKLKAAAKEYSRKNREIKAERLRQWRIDNPEKVAAHTQTNTQRARKKHVPKTKSFTSPTTLLPQDKPRRAKPNEIAKEAKARRDKIEAHQEMMERRREEEL